MIQHHFSALQAPTSAALTLARRTVSFPIRHTCKSPICAGRRRKRRGSFHSEEFFARNADSATAGKNRFPRKGPALELTPFAQYFRLGRDRKSTRLHSSH